MLADMFALAHQTSRAPEPIRPVPIYVVEPEIAPGSAPSLYRFAGRQITQEARNEIKSALSWREHFVTLRGVESVDESVLLNIVVLRRYLQQCNDVLEPAQRVGP